MATELAIVLDGTKTASGGPIDPARVDETRRICVIGMPRGTTTGRASVILRLTLADGSEVFGETTLRLLGAAVDALRLRYETH